MFGYSCNTLKIKLRRLLILTVGIADSYRKGIDTRPFYIIFRRSRICEIIRWILQDPAALVISHMPEFSFYRDSGTMADPDHFCYLFDISFKRIC